ncbi:MAG TPA: endonuclease [Candidatus Cloacimonadota bacterium]|nr:endonuclease [Candidatus Cloacimonadota bacterium]
MNPFDLMLIYERLLKAYGHQHWWPADTQDEVIIGTILTQNTNWQNVEKAIAQLKENRLCTLQGIIDADEDYLASCIVPSGYFRVKAKRLKAVATALLSIDIDKFNDEKLRKYLLSVHGIGCETADSIMLYAYQRVSFVIDTYTKRILNRIGIGVNKESYGYFYSLFMDNLTHDVGLFNEYHALIVRNAKVACKVKPDCLECPVKDLCDYGRNNESTITTR